MELTDEMKESIRQAGARCYPYGVNPWRRGTPGYKLWREGFKLARSKAKENDDSSCIDTPANG